MTFEKIRKTWRIPKPWKCRSCRHLDYHILTSEKNIEYRLCWNNCWLIRVDKLEKKGCKDYSEGDSQ